MKFSGNAVKISITLPDGKTFKAGDSFKIAGKGGNSGSAAWLVVGDDANTTTVASKTSDTFSSEVTLSDDFTASQTIVIRRATSSEKDASETAGGGTVYLKSIAYTAVAKNASSEVYKGVKIGGADATLNTDYTVDGNTITLTNSYSVAPTVALVKTVTYDDESTENADVAVALTKDGDYFTGTASIGLTGSEQTYTVKVPYVAPTNVAVTWSNEGGWSMRSVTTSTDTSTKLTSGAEVETGTSLIFTTDTGAGWDLTWYVNGVKQDQTTSPLTLEITGTTEVKSVYVARKKFTFSDNAKAKAFAAADGKITLSANNYSYEAGKTVDYWTDASSNKYYVGKEYTLTEDVALTPHFVDNTVALGDAAATVTWGFGYKADNTGCPVFTSLQGSGNTTNYVAQATVLGQSVDANLVCDATSGKIDNERRVGSGNSQTNAGSKFTIPVVKGSVVTIVGTGEFKASGKTASTINGSTDYTVTDKITATYTYTGETGTIEYVVGSDNTYVKSISVTYPDNSGRKYATWTADKTSGTSTLETASKVSDIENISNMTDMTLNGDIGYVSKKTANGNAGPGITTTKDKTDANFLSMTFDVANGYTFSPSVIALNMVSISNGKTFEVELSDATNTVTGSVAQSSTNAIPSDVYVINTADTKLSGTVTLKLWVYGATTGFRIGSINVSGTTEFTGSVATTLNSVGYATFSCASEVSVPEGVTAYTGKVDEDTPSITWTKIEDGIIPANEGVLLKGTASSNITLTGSSESKANITGNDLKANLTAMTNTADSHIYVLSGEDIKLLSSTGTLAANKAYFQLTKNVTNSSGAKAFIMIWDDEDAATAVRNVEGANAKATPKKYFKNGQLLIEGAKGTYNAAGGRVK